MVKKMKGWKRIAVAPATPDIYLVPSSFRDGGGSLPTDAEIIAEWQDTSGNALHFSSVNSPLYEATGTHAILDGTAGGVVDGAIADATPKYFRRASGLTAVGSSDDFTAVLAFKPVIPADDYTSVATHLTNVPRQSRWGTGEIMAIPSVSSDLYESGLYVSDDLTPVGNGTPDIGAHQFKLGKRWHGPRRLQNGYLCGIPAGWEIADPADAASETGISETGTAVLYFKFGSDYIAAWKQTSSGATRWTNFATELGTYYTYRDGLGIKTDYSKGARIEDDGLLVVYFSGDDEVAKTFMWSLYTAYVSSSQQTSYGVTTNGNLTGFVTQTTIFVSIPWQSGDTGMAVEYKLTHETPYRNAMDGFRETGGAPADEWTGGIFNLAPGETYDIRVTTAGEGAVTTTAVTRKPNKIPTGTVRSANVSTLTTVLSSTVAGDIVELDAGIYPARTISISGTQSAPIMFRPADEADPPTLERWTISGDDIWLDGLRSRYEGNGVGVTITTAATRTALTRLDVDCLGAGAATHVIQADGTECLVSDCWLAGGNPPRIPYYLTNQNESYAGEGVETYDATGCEITFCDISRVGDVTSYGFENIVMLLCKTHDHSDDFFEADHGIGPQAVLYNHDHQGGNNGISCQGMTRGPVFIIGNQLTASYAVASNQAGTYGGGIIKQAPTDSHTPFLFNTTQGNEAAQNFANVFMQDDNAFANNCMSVKKRVDGQNRIGGGTLSYGGDADWTGHMRLWSHNAYMSTSTIVWDFATDKSLAAIQANGVEDGSIQLANYSTTICPAYVGDWQNCVLYFGPDEEVDPTRPTGIGLALMMNPESGFELLTRRVNGTEDPRIRLAIPSHSNPVVIAVRWRPSTNTKELILNTGEAISSNMVASLSSALMSATGLVCHVGGNGSGEMPLQGLITHTWLKRGAMTNAQLNTVAGTIASEAGTTWENI